MKSLLALLVMMSFFACSGSNSDSKNQMGDTKRTLTYLALGDSYTIGEGVVEEDRYPNQLVKRLNEELNLGVNPPIIIAKTGWTVDELETGINDSKNIDPPYDLVTLLIGVNNQYRGRSVEDFKIEFEQILLRAIGFAGNLPDHVVVLSIPDWGVTPFAVSEETDQLKVASEIDAYNTAKKEVCKQFGVFYIDITANYRTVGAQPEMVVGDKLHPSGLVYAFWADKLYEKVKSLNLKP
jgi:lysophospholipase L1-like esterase